MHPQLDEILAQLVPIHDRVLLQPIGGADVEEFEHELGSLPECLRNYYQHVGLFQDLTAYGASEFEVHQRLETILETAEWLRNEAGSQCAFPFGSDGAGNAVFVLSESLCDGMYFFDHETREIQRLGTFCEWLSAAVAGALATSNDRTTNSTKRWCVHLSRLGLAVRATVAGLFGLAGFVLFLFVNDGSLLP